MTRSRTLKALIAIWKLVPYFAAGALTGAYLQGYVTGVDAFAIVVICAAIVTSICLFRSWW